MSLALPLPRAGETGWPRTTDSETRLREAMQRRDVWPEMLRRTRIETGFDARQQGQRVAASYRELADG